MQSILIKEQGARQTRRQWLPSARSRLVILALLGISCWGQLALGDDLRWKLKPGEVLRYAMEEKFTETSKQMEKEIKGGTTRTVNLSWNVKGVAENGDAEIVLRFERVRMHIEKPPFMPYDLDSSAAKIDAPEPFGSMARQFKAMAGAEFLFTLKPNGAIENLKVPENTLKSLRAGLPGSAQQGTFSEQGLKDLIAQSAPPPFPENASEPGRSWTSKPVKVPTEFGSVVIEQSFTTQGPDPKNPTVLLIGIEPKVSIEPQEGSGVSAKIQSQEGKGSMAFDTASGRILTTRLNQKMQMQLTSTADANQKLDQTTQTTSTMTLEP